MSSPSPHPIGSQELRELLLPALACLPTAFLSPKPPPALLPLLSPILRQRVYLQSANPDRNSLPSQSNGWLHLLTWSQERAARLAEVVSTLQLEAHPVSGELELFGDTNGPDAERVWYRSLDYETVQARCDVKEHSLGFVWVWCTNDTGGTGIENLMSLENSADEQGKNGWRVAEVLALEGDEHLELEGWQEYLEAAIKGGTSRQTGTLNGTGEEPRDGSRVDKAEEDDDDAYWAAYDRTPGKGSIAPSPGPAAARTPHGARGTSDQDYFERYGSEVQPAMDSHDPDQEAHGQQFESTFRRNEYSAENEQGQDHDRDYQTQNGHAANEQRYSGMNVSNGLDATGFRSHLQTDNETASIVNTHDPISLSVASLEASVSGSSAAEATIKHHISGEIKHLFKLSQGVGMDREEFESLVRRELEVLSLLE